MWGLSNMLNLSVKTCVSSPAQSLSTRPGVLPCPEAFCALILMRNLLTVLLDSCLLACLMPRDRLTLVVLRPTSSPALKAAFCVSHFEDSVHIPCQPWLLTGLDYHGLSDCYIINTPGDRHLPSLCTPMKMFQSVALTVLECL